MGNTKTTLSERNEPNIGAAIYGMYAAIKIARAYGVDWIELGKLVELPVIENEKKGLADDDAAFNEL